MNKNPIFTKVLITIFVAIACLVVTLLVAFMFGSVNADLFDFSNLNFSNVLPVIIVGGFISCIIVGILVIFLAKDIFIKLKNYVETEKNGGKKK